MRKRPIPNPTSTPEPGPVRLRAAHGAGAAAGAAVVAETLPKDGTGARLRPVDPLPADPDPRPTGAPFDSDTARTAAKRRWALAARPDFAKRELEYIPHADFQQFDEGRRDLLDRRIAEVVAATGQASAGVCTTLRGYAWLVAFGEYYAVRAAKTGSDKDAARTVQFFKSASQQLGVAWELARVEAKARPAKTFIERWNAEGEAP